jgi:hypothetical protein
MYTDEQKAFILSKVKDIRFDAIPEGIKRFWINYKNVN